jgi:glutamine synthetase
VLRNFAREAGVRCSFEPVVRPGHAGNGLHIHFSPMVGGEPVGGRRADGSLGDEALWLIAGLVEYGAALMAFGNRVPDSFLRLGQGKETPHGITWGDGDRHALVRLPLWLKTADGRSVSPPTIEFRLPDGSAHPHLLLAAAAQALCAGRELKDPAALVAQAAARPSDARRAKPSPLPRGAAEVGAALSAARAALEAGGVFPGELFERTLARLRA